MNEEFWGGGEKKNQRTNTITARLKASPISKCIYMGFCRYNFPSFTFCLSQTKLLAFPIFKVKFAGEYY